MDFSKLYQLQKNDLELASQVMTQAFFQDPLWKYLIPSDKDRLIQTKLIFLYVLSYAHKHGKIFSPSPNLKGIAVWLPANADPPNFWRLLTSGAFWKLMKIDKHIGNRVSKILGHIEQRRKQYLQEYSNYFYLEGLAVQPSHQNHGIGSYLLKTMIEYVDEKGFPLYLETNSSKNVKFYEKHQFEIIDCTLLANSSIYLWEMVYRPISSNFRN